MVNACNKQGRIALSDGYGTPIAIMALHHDHVYGLHLIFSVSSTGELPLVDFGGNRSTMSKSGTQTRGLSPLFIGRQTHAQVY